MIEERALADGKTLPKTADGVDATVLIGQPIFVRTASVPEEHRAIALIFVTDSARHPGGNWYFAVDEKTGRDELAVPVKESYSVLEAALAAMKATKEPADG